MKLSREEVLHISQLARLGLTGEDEAMFQDQLSNILEHFRVLEQVDTTGVPPTAQSVPLQSVMRPDEVMPSLSHDDALANAPRQEGDYVRVKAVLEE